MIKKQELQSDTRQKVRGEKWLAWLFPTEQYDLGPRAAVQRESRTCLSLAFHKTFERCFKRPFPISLKVEGNFPNSVTGGNAYGVMK